MKYLIVMAILILENISMQYLREANNDSAYFVDEYEIDMKVIISVLDAIVNPTQKLRDLGPSMIYMSELADNPYSGETPTMRTTYHQKKYRGFNYQLVQQLRFRKGKRILQIFT